MLELVFYSGATVWDQRCRVDDDPHLCLDVRVRAEPNAAVEEEEGAIVRVSVAGGDRKVESAQTMVRGIFFGQSAAVEGSELLTLAETSERSPAR